MFHPPGSGAPSSSEIHSEVAVDVLQRDVERLLMITEALWQLLKEHAGYSDEVLVDCVEAIDMRDGSLDGQVAATPVRPCPYCTRPLARHRPQCMYCGGHVEQNLWER